MSALPTRTHSLMPGQIVVKTPITNTQINIDVDGPILVKTLKTMIEAKEGISVDRQILLFADQELDDNELFSAFALEGVTTIYCVLRCRPAQPTPSTTSTPSAIKECHNYVRITGPPELIERLVATNLEPAKLYRPMAKDILEGVKPSHAKWRSETFGTEWVVNEDNSGPPVIHGISNGGSGISSRFVSHQNPPIPFYKLLHKDYPTCSIYYEYNSHHAQTVGYGELSATGSYSSTHHYTTEKQLDDILRTHHWRLPIAF